MNELLAAVAKLETVAKVALVQKRAAALDYLAFAAQLDKFNVCPCIALGRFSTCCGTLL